ncbi:MAG: hypothetical protein R2754_16805 [Microthrixaceae bacterium]
MAKRPSGLPPVLILVVVAAATAVILVVAGIGPWERPPTLVIGDSVTNLSRDEIEDTTGALVNAKNGYTWSAMAPKVRGVLDLVEEPPERVGVLLGYNDVLNGELDQADPPAVLDQLTDVDCVVVLELPKIWARDVDAHNELLRELSVTYPNVSVDDGWATRINENLADDASLLQKDLVHPDGARAHQALADAYQRAFERHC